MPVNGYTPPGARYETPEENRTRRSSARRVTPEPVEIRELSLEETKLLEGLRDGTADFGAVQREVAARAFEKILRDPRALKVKDWLTSELIKIKKEESQAKIGAMEVFVRKMFSGNLPLNCPHCGYMLFQEGSGVHVERLPDT